HPLRQGRAHLARADEGGARRSLARARPLPLRREHAARRHRATDRVLRHRTLLRLSPPPDGLTMSTEHPAIKDEGKKKRKQKRKDGRRKNGESARTGAPSVAEIFETMEYGPAPESDSIANAWLDAHGRRFDHFIGGRWVAPSGGA